MTDGIKQAILNGVFLIFGIFLTYLLTTNDESQTITKTHVNNKVPNSSEMIINGPITGNGHSFNNKDTINQYNNE